MPECRMQGIEMQMQQVVVLILQTVQERDYRLPMMMSELPVTLQDREDLQLWREK